MDSFLKSNNGLKIIAIVAIALLETVAMLSGIDGKCFGIAIGAISALAGYVVGNQRGKNGKS